MKRMGMPMGVLVLCLLSACAVTPEQRAQQQAQAQREQQVLAAALAEQCDPEAAALMRQQAADREFLTAAASAALAEQYRQKMSNPLFQSCYRLAWENHLNQARLQAVQQMHMRDRMNDMLAYPAWCQGFRHGRPFRYRCAW